MLFYTTRDRNARVGLREAVRSGLPAGGGLYQPLALPRLTDAFLEQGRFLDYPALAAALAGSLIGGDIPASRLDALCRDAFDFPTPLTEREPGRSVLELFHGPTLAFKDFGARFLARLLGWFQRGENRELTVLVATSGDTGSAVAHGFYRVPGVRVVILYPRGRISEVQERQIATLGENITALDVAGSFDDCQRLVKAALADAGLREQLSLTTANSINIGRLLPQVFYYFYAWLQLPASDRRTVVAVPSGNFGNVTAAAVARFMGLPLDHLIAATTVNDTVPRFLADGRWEPHLVRPTLASAMDVAEPSNFDRLRDFYHQDRAAMSRDISACVVTDDAIRAAVRARHERDGYVLDPHSAAGWSALTAFLDRHGSDWRGFSLATAHPVKFASIIEPLIGRKLEIPARLRTWLERPKLSVKMGADVTAWKEWLREHGRN
jgi:threonine synthase